MRSLLQDLRYALRVFANRPAFTVVAVLMLALGIGANTSIFSLVNALLLRPLPFREPERVVMVDEWNGQWGGCGTLNLLDWRRQNTVFEGLAAMGGAGLTLTGSGDPERLHGSEVTANFLSLLGVRPLLGRGFLPGEDSPGRDQVVLLSYGLWQRRFGARPDIVGRSLKLDGGERSVIGVLPPDYPFPDSEALIPMTIDPAAMPGRRQHQYGVLGRLKPGVSIEAARAQMATIARRLEEQYPDTNKGWTVKVSSLRAEAFRTVGPALVALSAAVGFVLLIACANVANLLLARAATRTREIAIRATLGAGRARLVRQLLTESALLSLAGGALGFLLALWGIEGLPAFIPRDMGVKLGMDWRVLAFTALASMVSGLLFGLAPAVHGTRLNLNEALKSSAGPALGSRGHSRFLQAVTVGEVALAVVLLVGAGLLIESFAGLLQVDLGFRPRNVLAVGAQLPWRVYGKPHHPIAFYRELLERIRALPGVESAGGVDCLPMSGGYSGNGFEIEGRPAPRRWDQMEAQGLSATTGYFRTLGIPLLRGRYFTAEDQLGAPRVVLVSQTLAQRFFPKEDPTRHRIRHGPGDWLAIVGVVGDVKQQGPGRDPDPAIYFPFDQAPSTVLTLTIRTTGDPLGLAAAVRDQIRKMDREVLVGTVQTMEQAVSRSLADKRLMALFLAGLAALALLLAAVGLYGVVSDSVSQRTHELGVRMALGAARTDVVRLVVGQGMLLTGAGILIGLAGAFVVTRALSSLLYGVTPTDATVFALVPLLLAAASLAACYLPARRASRVDPIVALRCE